MVDLTYESTLDDAVDASVDSFARSSGGRDLQSRDRRQSVVVVALIPALVSAFSIVREGGVAEFGVGRLWVNVILVLVLAATMYAIHGSWFRWIQRKRLRRMYQQQRGSGPFPCELRLKTDGVSAAQPGITIEFPWSDAEGLEDTPERIRLWFRMGVVHVPADAFETSYARDQFVQSVQSYLDAAAAPG